ncbi:MAG TPA: F390 synthetase-related protein [Prosthecobacter sp.]
MSEPLLILWHFIRTRWLPKLPASWRLRRFLRATVRECPHYHDIAPPQLENFPFMAKRNFLAHFADLNRHHITLDDATATALRAERERDFQPQLPGGVTVGLSSGTSGTRHVFLVSRADRCRWAGQIFARMLSRESLRQLIMPWRAPLRIAFFLRASSNLYTTLRSRRVQFSYYDLTRPFADLLQDLAQQQPHILVAPATVLAEIAKHTLRHSAFVIRHSLLQIISVAEVLDTRDRSLIEQAFSLPVGQIYQAAEGFLGASCPHGRVHLNEDSMHIERRWIDESRDRFQPIITDFSRQTQWFVRHHLTDILRPASTPCPCGAKTTSLESIEGRAEEILWSRDAGGTPQPVFPDVLRQALYTLPQPPQHYRIEQQRDEWLVRLQPFDHDTEHAVETALKKLHQSLRLTPPNFHFLPWTEQPPDEKQKRLRCVVPPA